MEFVQEMWRLALEGKLQGVWFWGGIYALVLCLYSFVFQARTRSWPWVAGELLKAEVEEFGGRDLVVSEQDYTSEALYRYRVDDQELEGSRISPWVFVASHNARAVLKKQLESIQHLPEGGVKVFYNPRKPQKSYLIVAGRLGLLVTLLAGSIPLASFFLKFPL